jgi:hypothetical protein
MSVYVFQPTARSRPRAADRARRPPSATTRSVTAAAVQRLTIPEARPTLPLAASLGLTFSSNVMIKSRSASSSPAWRGAHFKRCYPSSMRTAVGNPRKADREHQFGHSSRRLPAGFTSDPDTRDRLYVSKMFPSWHSARRLFVKVMSIVRKDRLTKAATGAARGKLHEFRMSLTHNLFEPLSRGRSPCYRL